MASLELPNVMLQPQEPMATWWLTSTRQSLINFACSAPCTLMKTFPRHLLVDPSPSPEQEGGPPTWDIRTIPGWWRLHLLPRTRHGSRAMCSRILPPTARLPPLVSPTTAAVAGSQRQPWLPLLWRGSTVVAAPGPIPLAWTLATFVGMRMPYAF